MLDREIDALVAIHVFDWARRTTQWNHEQTVVVPADWTDLSAKRWLGHSLYELVAHYSTSWDAAGLVAEKMTSMEWELSLSFMTGRLARPWDCRFFRMEGQRRAMDQAESAQLAICKAALKALGVEVPSAQ